jgi:diaminopimelate epimerase
MEFAKYQGIGNDFVMFADPDDRMRLDENLARRLCDRRFGIGGDGVIRVIPGREGGELFMDYYNSDGSIGEMCGNGIRCLALFAREKGMTTSTEIKVETRAGLKVVQIEDDRVRVDMGPPEFEAASIPVKTDGDPLHVRIELEDQSFEAASLGMGNPHAVIFTEDPDTIALESIGPRIETHAMFPELANVEFARVESPDEVRMRVWERGSGQTLACGTGACAVAVAARVLAGTNPTVTVHMPGGDLEVEWAGSVDDPKSVYMTGPAEKSFEGTVDLEAFRN